MMTLKNGSFFKDGVKVPLEFGNKEQIQLLEKSQALLEDDGILAYIDDSGADDHTALEYTCMCGCHFRRDYDLASWNAFRKDKFTCEGCGLKYLLDGDKFDPFVVVKLEKVRRK